MKDGEQLNMDFGAANGEAGASARPSSSAEAPAPPAAPASVHEHSGPLKRLVDGNFLHYASYVIRDRAIPEARDGLKPVQRRILYSLHEKDDGKFIKVANIVGYCMQYHPHGDASIADALVSLTNRGYLIEGQGNFGNLFTGDCAAAPRYIECRLTDLARSELFNDELTEFVPSYDGRNKEPTALPAKIPLLLMLGAEGIAVGLSTRIFPHNFAELLEAQIAILNKKPFKLAPDFPQGGLMDLSEYDRGFGRIRLRAIIETRDRETLVIRQIPFGTTTDSVIAGMEDAARRKKINIRSINDFTADRIEIVVALAPGEDAEKAIQALYAFTPCEIALSGNAVVIRDRRPVEMNVQEILRYNTEQLVATLKKELQLEKKHLLDDLHAKTLVQLFVEHRVYKRIETCQTAPDVEQAVLGGMQPFRPQLRRDITQADIEMLLEVRIKRISLFDMNKNRREIDDIVARLDDVETNLSLLVPYAVRYLKNLLKKHGAACPRRTRIERFEAIAVRELTASELTIRHDRDNGYLGSTVDGKPCFDCSSLDKIILVWRDGRYKLMPPPEKLFVDRDLLYAGRFDRDRIMTVVYTHDDITYIKRFAFGGTIMNKTYHCASSGSLLRVFTEDTPEALYVRYAPAKGQRIHQQVFKPSEVSIKNVKARGIQMTIKQVESISVNKPRSWNDREETVPGRFFMK